MPPWTTPVAQVLDALAPGYEAVPSPMAGAVWKLLAAEGDRVAAEQPLLVLQAMRAEITVAALRCCDDAAVAMGQRPLDLA